jgi:hypothetical protein
MHGTGRRKDARVPTHAAAFPNKAGPVFETTDRTVGQSVSQQSDEMGFSRSTEAEDVKAKRHRQYLSRVLQTKRKLADEPPVDDIKADVKADVIDFGPTVDELLGIKTDTNKKKTRKSKRAKKTRTIRGHRVGLLVRYGIEILRGEHARLVRRRPRPCQVQRVAR